jgi:hypothetical protein
MKLKFSTWLVGAALALTGSIVTPVMADDWNKETRIEISEPLEIPGMVLTPGTYIFKLADSVDRHIVQVYSEDADGNQHFVKMFFAIAAYRLNTPDKPIINLEERAAGAPQAIHTWFYPGRNDGWEFVYPKSERLELAAAPAPPPAPAPVVAPPVAPAPEPVVEVQAEEQVVSAPVEEPAPAAVEEPVVVAVEETQSFELPETAGHSSVVLLGGAVMLGLGLMIVVVALRRAEA